MKLIKNLMLLFAISFFVVGCEQELLQEEVSSEETATTVRGKAADAFIRRGKLKQRPRVGYKVVTVVADINDLVQRIDGEVFSTNEFIPTIDIYSAEATAFDGEDKKFVFNGLDFENGSPNGWPIKQKISFYDIEDQQVGTPQDLWLTPQDEDGVDILTVKIKQNGPRGNYKVKTKIQAVDSTDSSTVTYYFTAISEDGMLEKDKTIGYEPSDRVYNFKEVTGLSAELEVIDYNDGEDIRSKINPETNSVGVIVEVRNELGQIMDDDLFVVNIENTAPEGIQIKSTKHRIRTDGNSVIRVKLEGTDVEQASYAEWPDLSDGGRVRLDENGELDFEFVSDPQPIENVSIGDFYQVPISVFNEGGEVIAVLEAEFNVTGPTPTDPVTFGTLAIQSMAGGDAYEMSITALTVGDSDANPIERVTVTFEEPFEGPTPLETEVELSFMGIDGDLPTYGRGDILFEAAPVGFPYPVKILAFDVEGNVLAETTQEVVIEE
ncbi:hypothetical protein [Gilvibacter sp.]|uniref:hypothetical protein n=1 Tax=Gilvibacter sp. TaxID=2729997 RepID=UPI0025BAC901|nr:hypothetical protein [Gilvibacter sp.]NQX76726.1 hypothetical protein [Gilvibacter sp.]